MLPHDTSHRIRWNIIALRRELTVDFVSSLSLMTEGRLVIRKETRASPVTAGNLTPLPGIFLDHVAPIVRASAIDTRKLVEARRGPPGPSFAL